VTSLPELWPHQEYGVNKAIEHFKLWGGPLCFSSPTGGGKSRCMMELIKWADSQGKTSALYTSRKMLTEQISDSWNEQGFEHGVRAASFNERRNDHASVQVCSIQTEAARVLRRRDNAATLSFEEREEMFPLPPGDLVIIDEPHMNAGESMLKIVNEYHRMGSHVIGFTATPLGISQLFPDLLVAGTNSSLRECGAHVPCRVYGVEELDTSHISRTKTGEYSYKGLIKTIWTQSIFGHALKQWKTLNPDARPTILFAPGVKESVWFTGEFRKAGVSAAHIDGNDIVVDGKEYASDSVARKEVLQRVREGDIKVVCSRYVLREGVDIPELYHCILACPIGSLLSYCQAVGRVIRAHPSMDHCILQDHGGNWYRFGSPNQDRNWHEIYNENVRDVTTQREEDFREKKEPEPICCPECGLIRAEGPSCPACGFRHSKSSRVVLQVNGELKQLEGPVYKPRKTTLKSDTQKQWEKVYYRLKNAKKDFTFSQARGFFYRENGYWPPENCSLMPVNKSDWKLPIKLVERGELM